MRENSELKPLKMRRGNAAGYIVAAVFGGMIGGGIVLFAGRALAPSASVLAPRQEARAYTEVVDRQPKAPIGDPAVNVQNSVGPAVIAIDTQARVSEGFAFGGGIQQGQGSGFIINGQSGLAVTNNHVVEGAQRIVVTLPDKRTFPAEVVGTDPIGDIAVIRLRKDDKDTLPEIKFGDSDQLQVGQTVVAIGAPLGLEHSVTQGVLSATGRKLDGQLEGIPLENLLQTDAAINPGNSGGPLLDAQGRVIGMNTAIIQRAQGIGFAVAANAIKEGVKDILEHGRVIRPWIGVSMADLSPSLRERAGVPAAVKSGVVIADVRGGQPADRAGLRPGDVITEAAGKPLADLEALRDQIRAMEPGQKLELKGYRGSSVETWSITLGEMPAVVGARR